jgi:hypothetical protein
MLSDLIDDTLFIIMKCGFKKIKEIDLVEQNFDSLNDE